MSKMFKSYRRECFTAIRELLAHRGSDVVEQYVSMAKATKTENELSRIMVAVRENI